VIRLIVVPFRQVGLAVPIMGGRLLRSLIVGLIIFLSITINWSKEAHTDTGNGEKNTEKTC
jgi:hypothetical protein